MLKLFDDPDEDDDLNGLRGSRIDSILRKSTTLNDKIANMFDNNKNKAPTATNTTYTETKPAQLFKNNEIPKQDKPKYNFKEEDEEDVVPLKLNELKAKKQPITIPAERKPIIAPIVDERKKISVKHDEKMRKSITKPIFLEDEEEVNNQQREIEKEVIPERKEIKPSNEIVLERKEIKPIPAERKEIKSAITPTERNENILERKEIKPIQLERKEIKSVPTERKEIKVNNENILERKEIKVNNENNPERKGIKVNIENNLERKEIKPIPSERKEIKAIPIERKEIEVSVESDRERKEGTR